MCGYVDIRAKGQHCFVLSPAAFAQSWVQCDYELMKHLVVLPFEVFTPASISTGIEVWTWVISEKPEYEIGVMMEINSAWLATVRFGKGMFSTSQKYSDLNLLSSLIKRILTKSFSTVMTIRFSIQFNTARQTKKELVAGWPTRSGCWLLMF